MVENSHHGGLAGRALREVKTVDLDTLDTQNPGSREGQGSQQHEE
jgi:hypothetical protein